jgi:hypothetical protein
MIQTKEDTTLPSAKCERSDNTQLETRRRNSNDLPAVPVVVAGSRYHTGVSCWTELDWSRVYVIYWWIQIQPMRICTKLHLNNNHNRKVKLERSLAELVHRQELSPPNKTCPVALHVSKQVESYWRCTVPVLGPAGNLPPRWVEWCEKWCEMWCGIFRKIVHTVCGYDMKNSHTHSTLSRSELIAVAVVVVRSHVHIKKCHHTNTVSVLLQVLSRLQGQNPMCDRMLCHLLYYSLFKTTFIFNRLITYKMWA